MALKTHSGSCHCGAVRYEAELDLAAGSNRCNCSYCTKARAWFAFAKGAGHFRVSGAESLAEYRWAPPGVPEPFLTYAFCKTCGVRVFARGEMESLGGTFHAVPVNTLDLTPEQLAEIPIRYIDGRNNDFESAPAVTAWM